MRLIDADALINDRGNFIVIGAGDNICIDISDIEKAPTIEAEPVKHGRWVEKEKYTFGIMYDCSLCENRILDNGHSWNYCPNCGAKMTEDIDEQKK